MKVVMLGNDTKEEIEKRLQIVASAGNLSRADGTVTQVFESNNDYDKNLKLARAVVGYGHKSIAEHDYIVFALEDVTPIVEQTIIGYRLTSFTIKSRREVDFRTAGFYVPEFRNKDGEIHENNEELKEKFINHSKMLFNTYGDIVDGGVNVEDARFILPYCFHSNIIMGLNARELEKMIVAFRFGPLSKIAELKELGKKLYAICKESVPYLVSTIKDVEVNDGSQFEYLESMVERPEIKIADKAKLISYTPNADDVVLESSIMYHYQCSNEEAKNILKEMVKKDKDAKSKLMQNILHKEERRELEQVSFSFQIPISLSILTHLTRHRMHALLVPEFTPMWDLNNYVTPEKIKVAFNDIYQAAVKKNIEVFEEFKAAGVMEEDLIYFYIGAQMVNVMTTMNARNIQWVCRMRCCNKAQWQIRFIAKEIVLKDYFFFIGSSCWTRTNDLSVNSRALYRLS